MMFAKKIYTTLRVIRQLNKWIKSIIIYLKQFSVSLFGKDYRWRNEPVNQIYIYWCIITHCMVITMCNFVMMVSINENCRG